jgi:hypothetical protein
MEESRARLTEETLPSSRSLLGVSPGEDCEACIEPFVGTRARDDIDDKLRFLADADNVDGGARNEGFRYDCGWERGWLTLEAADAEHMD